MSDIAGTGWDVSHFFCQFLKSLVGSETVGHESDSSDTRSIRQRTTSEPIAGLIRVVYRSDGPVGHNFAVF